MQARVLDSREKKKTAPGKDPNSKTNMREEAREGVLGIRWAREMSALEKTVGAEAVEVKWVEEEERRKRRRRS